MRLKAFHDRIANRPWIATSDLVFWIIIGVGTLGPPVGAWALGWPPSAP